MGKDVGVAPPVRKLEDAWEMCSATHAIEKGLGRAERTYGDDALIEKRLQGSGDVFYDSVGATPAKG